MISQKFFKLILAILSVSSFAVHAEKVSCVSMKNEKMSVTLDFTSQHQATQRNYDNDENVIVTWGIDAFVRIKEADRVVYVNSALNLLSKPDQKLTIISKEVSGTDLHAVYENYPMPIEMTCSITGIAIPAVESCHNKEMENKKLLTELSSVIPNPVRVEERIACGADVNLNDLKLRSPLHYLLKNRTHDDWLIESNFQDTIAFMLVHGALVDAKDRDGNTPLMLAAKSGQNILVESILNGKPDIRLQNNSHKTAYDLAKNNDISEWIMDELNPVSPK